jgi:hypothetical protein
MKYDPLDNAVSKLPPISLSSFQPHCSSSKSTNHRMTSTTVSGGGYNKSSIGVVFVAGDSPMPFDAAITVWALWTAPSEQEHFGAREKGMGKEERSSSNKKWGE